MILFYLNTMSYSKKPITLDSKNYLAFRGYSQFPLTKFID